MFKFVFKYVIKFNQIFFNLFFIFLIVNIVLYQFQYSDFEVKGQTRLQVYWFHFLPLFYIFHQLKNYDPEVNGQIWCSLKLQILISISTTRFYFVRHIFSFIVDSLRKSKIVILKFRIKQALKVNCQISLRFVLVIVTWF